MRKIKSKGDGVRVRGFLRGQIVDRKTGKIVGDTGWKENLVTTYGLTALALLIAGNAGGKPAVYGSLGTQTDAITAAQTVLSGTANCNSFQALTTSISGTATAQFTCQFGSASQTAATIGAVALHTTNAAGGLIAGQIFTTSQMTTAQDFNLTYQLRFATSA